MMANRNSSLSYEAFRVSLQSLECAIEETREVTEAADFIRNLQVSIALCNVSDRRANP